MNSQNCHGCQGIQALTPRLIHNRSGLTSIDYRVGTHAAFFETMLAKIAQHSMRRGDTEVLNELIRPLESLTDREADDPAIALLDSWSTIADVLSFYNERIATPRLSPR